MMQRSKLVILCLCGLAAAKAQEIRTVMILGNEICVRTNSGAISHLTNDDIPKRLPVWSKDGKQIALAEKAGTLAMAKVVVIDENGSKLSEVLIHPNKPNEVPTGMRYVEAIEWLEPHRVAISGSMNPSTIEYQIIDVNTGAVVKQFFDEGNGAAFSSDGAHYAYVSGRPHFTPANECAPTLNVDDKAVFSERGDQVEFIDVPHWSQDDQSVAALIKNPQTEALSVVIWRQGATRASTIAAPLSPKESMTLFWNRSALYVMGDSSKKIYMLREGLWSPVEGNVVDPRASAEILKSRLKAEVRKIGGKNADFWCADCELTALARRSGEN